MHCSVFIQISFRFSGSFFFFSFSTCNFIFLLLFKRDKSRGGFSLEKKATLSLVTVQSSLESGVKTHAYTKQKGNGKFFAPAHGTWHPGTERETEMKRGRISFGCSLSKTRSHLALRGLLRTSVTSLRSFIRGVFFSSSSPPCALRRSSIFWLTSIKKAPSLILFHSLCCMFFFCYPFFRLPIVEEVKIQWERRASVQNC